MPDFPAPAANQLNIPDYSKTLNALAQMQASQAHTDLYHLQAQQQQLRQNALNLYAQDPNHDIQHLLNAGLAGEADQALKSGGIMQQQGQNANATLGSWLSTIPEKDRKEELRRKLSEMHKYNYITDKQGQAVFDDFNKHGISSLTSQGPQAVERSQTLAPDLYKAEQEAQIGVRKSATEGQNTARIRAGEAPVTTLPSTAPATAVPGAPVANVPKNEAGALAVVATNLSRLAAGTNRDRAFDTNLDALYQNGLISEATFDKYKGRHVEDSTLKDLSTRTVPNKVTTTPVAPATSSPSTPPSTGELERRETIAKEAGALYKDLPERQSKNRESLVTLQQLTGHLAEMGDKGLLTPGKYIAERTELANTLNTIAKSAGGKAVIDENKVAASQAANKLTSMMGFQDSTLLGHKEAADVVFANVKMQPGRESQAITNQKLLAGKFVLQKWQRDYHDYLAEHTDDPKAAKHFLDSHSVTQYGQMAEKLSKVPLADMHDLIQHADTPTRDLVTSGDNKTVRQHFNNQYGAGISDLLLDH